MASLIRMGWETAVAHYMMLGLVTTLELTLLCSVASLVTGTILGIAFVAEAPLLVAAVRLYVEIWRGLPLIVILFFVFFALPALGMKLSAFWAAAVGLSLWGSALTAENVRGAVQSIPNAQREGGRALGLSWPAMMCLVVLPQALRRLLPPTLNMLTSLIHGTSLSAQLGVLELLESGRRSIQRLLLDVGNSHSLEIFGAILLVYFVICYPLTSLSRSLERRLTV